MSGRGSEPVVIQGVSCPYTLVTPIVYGEYKGKADAFVLPFSIVDPLLAHPFQRVLSQPDMG